MSVTIRVVDCVYGRPAVGVSVDFTREFEGTHLQRWRDQTDDDGLITGLPETMRGRGSYTLVFDLDGYFCKLGYTALNSAISLRFHMASNVQRYSLSLLITPSSCVAFREG